MRPAARVRGTPWPVGGCSRHRWPTPGRASLATTVAPCTPFHRFGRPTAPGRRSATSWRSPSLPPGRKSAAQHKGKVAVNAVFVDVDTGIDDAMALVYLLASGDAEVVG